MAQLTPGPGITAKLSLTPHSACLNMSGLLPTHGGCWVLTAAFWRHQAGGSLWVLSLLVEMGESLQLQDTLFPQRPQSLSPSFFFCICPTLLEVPTARPYLQLPHWMALCGSSVRQACLAEHCRSLGDGCHMDATCSTSPGKPITHS